MVKLIGVIGGREASRETREKAYATGKLIAQLGAVLICGGLGGVMEAASRGAREAGGAVVGILPGQSKQEANPYVTIPLATGIGLARNSIIAYAADMLIAFKGSFGTLSEIAYGLQIGKPVISFGSWSLEELSPGEGVRVVENMAELQKELKRKTAQNP